ncbi:MAG: 30S ribosomal protein S6 [Sulfurovum sp.]|nr:30S ribosomal protein S6 [Sulfurovum sp.]
MNHYELLFVLRPTLTDEETKIEIEKIQSNIIAQDANIVVTDDMGMRKLAYPVEKNERGHYTVVYFQALGIAIAEIERLLRINEEILKFLTVKYTNKKDIAQFTKITEAISKKNTPAPAKEEVVVTEETSAIEETPVTEVEEAPVTEETQAIEEATTNKEA